MIATLPPDEDVGCAFVVEWRTEVGLGAEHVRIAL